jgi:hypothetical protein
MQRRGSTTNGDVAAQRGDAATGMTISHAAAEEAVQRQSRRQVTLLPEESVQRQPSCSVKKLATDDRRHERVRSCAQSVGQTDDVRGKDDDGDFNVNDRTSRSVVAMMNRWRSM